jgi:glutathione S-transferase
MSYTLYYSPDSANLVVRLALEEIGAPYTDVRMDRSVQAQRSPAYLALNPQGLLPVLIDPAQNAPLFETAAILLHLADSHQCLQPPEPADRGAFLKWLFYLSNTLHADLRVLFRTERYVSTPDGIADLRQGLRARVAGHFLLLDQQIAAHGGPWLLGPVVSVCDIYLACCARWAVLYPVDEALAPEAVAGLAHLGHMLRLLEQRPAVQRALQKEGLAAPGEPAFSAPQAPRQATGAILG